jgi:hypothetical protein
LHALAPPHIRAKMADLWHQTKVMHNDAEIARSISSRLRESPRTIAICYPKHSVTQGVAYFNFFALLERSGTEARLLWSLERNGRVIYEVFEIKGGGAGSTAPPALSGT